MEASVPTYHADVAEKNRAVGVDSQSLAEVDFGNSELLLLIVDHSHSIPRHSHIQ
jgi:hypothetical protein